MKKNIYSHKKIILQVIVLFFLIHTIFAADVQAQSAQSTVENHQGWERLTVKNGEFSIWIPEGFATYNDFVEHYKGDGKGSKFYEERVVNAYLERAVFVVKVYKVSNSKKALDDLISFSRQLKGVWEDIAMNGFKGKHLRHEEATYFRDVQYFSSNNYVYAVEVAARDAGNPLVKAFLSSLRLGKEAIAQDAAAPSINVSQLNRLPADLEVVDNKTFGFIRAVVINKPTPRYTKKARENQISGTVVLKMVLSSSGEVVDIEVIRGLKHGLTEEAIKAAEYIIFLPADLEGRPVSQHVTVEYNFNIY
jgi:TonB family C-terminal domain